MPSPMRRRTSSHAASASELDFRLSMKLFMRASSSQAELDRVRKSCSRVVPCSTSNTHSSPLRKHLEHDGLSPEHYRRKKSALLVTAFTSPPPPGENHLDLSFATLTTCVEQRLLPPLEGAAVAQWLQMALAASQLVIADVRPSLDLTRLRAAT